jgi:hypothetical protein
MEATNLEANPGAVEAVLKQQKLRKAEMNVDVVGSLEDRHKG